MPAVDLLSWPILAHSVSAGVALNASKAQAWRLSGLAEHSSVAAFARAALELMAVGAPAELGADAHQAAIDEVIGKSDAHVLDIHIYNHV